MVGRNITSIVVVSLTVGLLVGGSVQAQEGNRGGIRVDDPEGDVVYDDPSYEGTYGESEDTIDILAIEVGPDTRTHVPIAVTFIASPPDQEGDEDPQDPSTSITPRRTEVHFTYDGIAYMVYSTYQCNPFGLYQFDASGEGGRRVGCIDSTFDDGDHRISYSIPKIHVTSTTGAPLSVGDTLVGLHVVSKASQVGQPAVEADETGGGIDLEEGPRVYDVAPDNGLDFVLAAGGGASESPRFLAQVAEPVRATNGVEGMFRYEVTLTNPTQASISLTATLSDVWGGVDVFGNASVTVPAGETVTEDLYLSVPFGHAHGETKWFTVRYTSDDGQWREMDLGLHWLVTPQPAGHHPIIYFHSQSPEDPVVGQVEPDIWMNTVDEEDGGGDDAPVNAPGFSLGTSESGPGWSARWRVPLSPQLRLGLNFTEGGSHALSGAIEQLAPSGTVDVYAGLAVCTDDAGGEVEGDYRCPSGSEPLEVAWGTSTHTTGTDGVLTFATDMAVIPGAEQVPYDPDNQLMLSLVVYQIAVPSAGYNELSPHLVVDRTELHLDIGEYTEMSPSVGDAERFGDAQQRQELGATEDDPAEVHDAPVLGVPALLLVVGLLVRRLRE